jgi:2,4-dienoyl-CoA reductase-like NADH-dependent reductase (Old Yellow Enzyme family)
MSTSHACGLHDAGMPAERYQRYHEEKAIGGIALSMFGGSSNVAPDSPRP